jgi:hypothetical protein
VDVSCWVISNCQADGKLGGWMVALATIGGLSLLLLAAAIGYFAGIKRLLNGL